MKSRAHIKGHPLHSILVPFPIAFFTATPVLDLLFFFLGKEGFHEAALYSTIGGLLGGLAAALAGLIDYIYIIPPKSSANKRATKHALLNSTMMLIFAITLFLRLKNAVGLPVLIFLELAGAIIMTIAGWLGGTLMVRNQIGIDHRYANAGKWKEEYYSPEKKIELKELDKLGVNQMRLIHVNGKRIVLGKTETGLVAFEDFCTHRGGSLADGAMVCGTVQCPWHGSQFDVHTGAMKAGPAKENIGVYQLETEGERTYLRL
jgi:uncharacterized membrane protein/nitrite reductase/ring-hydroxylating ferredoxin subunit